MKILFEDDVLVGVEKPAHILIHPNIKFASDKITLMSMLRDSIKQHVTPINRLDRQASGIVLFAKDKTIISPMARNWNSSSTKKFYYSLVRTQFNYSGVRNFPLKHPENKKYQLAITQYTPLTVYTDSTLLNIEILTGRFHQIRRHFARTTHHVLGDRKYGKKKYNDHYKTHYDLDRLFLHAHTLNFIHPLTQQKIKIFSPMPPDLQNVLDKMHQKTILETGVYDEK